jgi:hypothetical protein
MLGSLCFAIFTNPFGAKSFQIGEGAAVFTAETDLVPVEKFEDVGVVMHVDGMGVLGRFEAPETHAAPVGNGHDFEEPVFDVAHGLEFLLQVGEKLDEIVFGLLVGDYGLREHAMAKGVLGIAGVGGGGEFALLGDVGAVSTGDLDAKCGTHWFTWRHCGMRWERFRGDAAVSGWFYGGEKSESQELNPMSRR